MVVGEPALMGGEFGDEDERLITRLENQQFEPNGTDNDSNITGEGGGQPFHHSDTRRCASPWSQDKKPPQLLEEPKKEPPH